MKKSLYVGVSLAALLAPLAHSQIAIDKAGAALSAADNYGISHYREIDFDKDGSVEVEGWLDGDWLVELDINAAGEVVHEERERRSGGPSGLTLASLKQALDHAKQQGMVMVEEIEFDASGIDIEGEDAQGRGIELENVQLNSKS